MVKVAEKFVEAVDRGQVLVAVAEMVFAELAGGVAQRLERLGNRDVTCLESDRRAGNADLGRPVRIGVWPVMKDERPAVQLFSA